MKLSPKDLLTVNIGNWSPQINPDGVLMWFKPLSKTVVMATPHFDELNVVSVDVIPTMEPNEDDLVLTTSFKLDGKSVEHDKKIYIAKITEIIKLLK